MGEEGGPCPGWSEEGRVEHPGVEGETGVQSTNRQGSGIGEAWGGGGLSCGWYRGFLMTRSLLNSIPESLSELSPKELCVVAMCDARLSS